MKKRGSKIEGADHPGQILRNLFRPTNARRFIFFLSGDILLISLSFYLAFYLRFEFTIPPKYLHVFISWLPIVVVIKILFLWLARLYRVNWTFVGIREFRNIAKAVVFSTAAILGLNYIDLGVAQDLSVPRGVILIDSVLALVFIGGFRISKRICLEYSLMNIRKTKTGKRVIIIGAGPTGERMARELLRSEKEKLHPVAFVDDDPAIIGTMIHEVPVLGNCQAIPGIVERMDAEEAIVALPTANNKKIREVFNLLSESGVRDIKIVPNINQFPKDMISIKDIRDIDIEDLLSRDTVRVDEPGIREFLKDKTILVTGAGGSIGSEIVAQVLRFKPRKIIAYEIDETEIYDLSLRLNGHSIIPSVGDIRDVDKLKQVFRKYKPEVVFHSAAYKHVPLMEYFPDEAVKTNVFGTYNLARLSVECGVHKFVNISTDKAVNPTSVMGMTKRLAELICSSLNQSGKTEFISVRFGNVIGSRGSVVPTFLEQIKGGRSLTVTDPEMKRYFMTTHEAVLLVCQAAAMGNGAEVFVLDMGEPVRIVKLAEDLIRVHGLEPYTDVEIAFTGPRPGEKLSEDLLTAEERTNVTSHEKIFVAEKPRQVYNSGEMETMLSGLSCALSDSKRLRETLKTYVLLYRDN